MGIIQRQGSKNSIVSFAGVVIGGISLLFIYPLDDEIYGLAQFIYSMSMLLMPFATLGILPSTLKFYPQFKTEDRRNNGVLPLLIMAMIFSLGIFFVLFQLFKEGFLLGMDYLDLKTQIFEKYELFIWVLLFILAFIQLFQNYAQSFKRIVVPQILNGFAFKVGLPVFVLVYYLGYINEVQYLNLILGFFGVVLILMISYVYNQGHLKLPKINFSIFKNRYKELIGYSLFSSLTGIGNMLAFRIDTIMVAAMVSLTGTGIYAKILFIAGVIDLPVKSLNQIASPVISEKMSESNLEEVDNIYRKTSINGLLIGGLLFILIWNSIENLFAISNRPESFEDGKMIFFFLGIGKLVDIATSVNTHILIYSKYYKYNIIFISILGLANILFNYHYIGIFGVRGAAIATCISLILYNVVKFAFIYWKIGIQPFAKSTLQFLLLFGVVFTLFHFIPDFGSPLINILWKSLSIAILYLGMMFRFEISPDLNGMMAGVRDKFFKR